jgi:putative phosphoribosyl transferase
LKRSKNKILISEVVRLSPNKTNGDLFVEGNLIIPDNPIGMVIFAHGSGSGKASERNKLISRKLNENNIATLLFDLLSEQEQEYDRQLENLKSHALGATFNKFNISLLTRRLSLATDWVLNYPKKRNLEVAYFGSSTGAAAAIIAACKYNVNSIIIRSGRTDLVRNELLLQIVAPCLFIVGGKDKAVININKQTIKKLRNAEKKELKIVPDASHLFQEAGSLETVANISIQWFKNHFDT